ncbi:PLD nuclease N-terminal domain-containing protein [Salisediminibacterium beveridgei]|uniref:Cardiolipin synthase N-terminal domain-containing protein n=1 Tax=Salisediminibacterium beveridgei TaxID=632773 RepID=A0A1D7QX47_9BACI|nr:PLD nuclease N-terminal domain-containing protein [Salisediminibacterium beveridgei]AOM83592.1 hypothetical protein BBEV_2234 [Salisediminibacterium beveridgei]
MEELLGLIDWAIVAPLLALQLILMVVALFDCVRSDNVREPKWVWYLVIIFVNIIGPIVYFVFGKVKD